MENTSHKSNPAIEFSSGFCDSDFKMKMVERYMRFLLILMPKAAGVYCSNSVT